MLHCHLSHKNKSGYKHAWQGFSTTSAVNFLHSTSTSFIAFFIKGYKLVLLHLSSVTFDIPIPDFFQA